MILTGLLILSYQFLVVSGRYGVDLSVSLSLNQWYCLTVDHNVSYAIIRAYRSTGVVDANAPVSIRQALSFPEVKEVDVYMFPCIATSSYAVANNITCDSASKQVEDIATYLAQNNIYFKSSTGKNDVSSVKISSADSNSIQDLFQGLATIDITRKLLVNRLWLDIEDEVPSKYYDSNISVNTAFLEDVVAAMKENSINIGIYTTKTYWTNIMGDIEGYGGYPLWYPRYDGVDDMSFFEPFAGWESAYIKQTGGDVGYCDISQVDSDYLLD